ncbi:MAG: hypothetical protein LBC93_07650 [Synergistaceae bacterium]|jgi:hypothetical protein|nr:hypothetical protein [Synergistaceae bacterium]
MKKGSIVLTAVFILLFASLAAEAGIIRIKNNTGVEIVELYISDSGTNDWEEDVLGSDTLSQGETLNLTVNGSYRKFDLRITDGENALDFFGLDGSATSIVLNSDGTASYQ